MEPVEVVRERFISAPSVEAIWQIVEPIERLPEWLSMCDRAELLSGEGVGRRQRLHGTWGGRHSEIDQIVVAYQPGRLLSWKHERELLDGKPAPQVSAETTFRIEIDPRVDGVLVRLRSIHLPASAFKRIVIRMVAARVAGSMMKKSLNRLSAVVAATTPR